MKIITKTTKKVVAPWPLKLIALLCVISVISLYAENVVPIKNVDSFKKSISGSKVVIVYFGIKNNKESEKQRIAFDEAAKVSKDMLFLEVLYSQENSPIFKDYKVSKIPSTIFFKDGKVHAKAEKFASKENILKVSKEKIYVRAIKDDEFEAATSKGYVFVDFWAPWCGPCVQLAPHVKAVAKKLDGKMSFYKINTDNNKKYMQQYEIGGIPALLIFKDGKMIKKLVGYREEATLLKELTTILKVSKEKIYVRAIKDDEFEAATSKGYVFVDFWAPWCGPCVQLAPHVKAVAKKLDGKMSFYKINTDNNKKYMQQYEIGGIPALLIFKDGKMIKKLVGYREEATLLKELTTILEMPKEKIYVRAIKDDEFEAATGIGYVFVDFWAPWCGPCVRLAPHVKAVAKKLDSKMSFYKINTDNNKKYMKQYEIRGIPTLLIFKDGKMIKKLVGYRNEASLLKELTDILPKQYVRSIKDAEFESVTSKGYVLVDFWAQWCLPCIRLAPHVKAAAKKLDGKMSFYKINTDGNKKYMKQYDVRSIPVLLIFKDGKMIKKLAGYRNEASLLKELTDILSKE